MRTDAGRNVVLELDSGDDLRLRDVTSSAPNDWKMANATWECQTCEWDFAGRVEGPIEGEEPEPEVELYSDPDDSP